MTLAVPEAAAVDVGQILQAMKVDLAGYLPELKGNVVVARDPLHALDLLCEAPDGFSAVLNWDGETTAESRINGVCESRFRIVLVANTALHDEQDKTLFEKRGSKRSVLGMVSAVLERALAWRFPANLVHEQRVFYSGCDPVTGPEGLPRAAYALRFSFYYPLVMPGATVTIAVSEGGEICRRPWPCDSD